MRNPVSILVVVTLLLAPRAAWAAQNAPANVAAPLTLKVLSLENKTAGAGDITIYVLGGGEIVSELQKGVGSAVGGSKLATVERGFGLPASAPTVLFIADPAMVADGTAYSRSNKLLSATNQVDLIAKGVTLGLGLDGGSPTIMLNLTASVAEGLDWEPAIMNIAKTVQ